MKAILHTRYGPAEHLHMGEMPEPAFSEHALRSYGALPQSSCLIGDSPFDEQAATSVGMDCVLVATGRHTRRATECSITQALRE